MAFIPESSDPQTTVSTGGQNEKLVRLKWDLNERLATVT